MCLGWWALNRGAIECCDPISEPISKRFVFLTLGVIGCSGEQFRYWTAAESTTGSSYRVQVEQFSTKLLLSRP